MLTTLPTLVQLAFKVQWFIMGKTKVLFMFPNPPLVEGWVPPTRPRMVRSIPASGLVVIFWTSGLHLRPTFTPCPRLQYKRVQSWQFAQAAWNTTLSLKRPPFLTICIPTQVKTTKRSCICRVCLWVSPSGRVFSQR